MTKIGITGRRRRGKGALSAFLRELRPALWEHNFADALKLDVAEMLNWAITDFGITRDLFDLGSVEALNSPENRALLTPIWQWYGTEFARAGDPDYWIKRFDAEYGHLDDIVVTDCRFPNEAQYLRDHGFTLVRIEGPQRGDDPRSDDHPSERYVDTLLVDAVYINDGTLDDLWDFAADLLLNEGTRCN